MRGEMELVLGPGFKGLQALGVTIDEAILTRSLAWQILFEALVSMQNLFDDTKEDSTTEEKDEPAPSYFTLFEDDEDKDYKSASGQKHPIGEFTSYV